MSRLSDEQIEAASEVAGRNYRRHMASVRGQTIQPADCYEWHFAHAVADAAVAAEREGRGDRDCGCAHHWNCKALAPSGVKPVLRPVRNAVQAEREGQEAVAWGMPNTAITGRRNALIMVRLDIPSGDQYGGDLWVPLYTTPPAAPAIPQDVEKDAERYRWLRANWTTMRSSATDTTLKLTTGEEPWADFGPDVIDAAIDLAALAAAPQPCSVLV